MSTILQVIPRLGAGGAEQTVPDVAGALLARGDRPLVVSQGGALVATLDQMGVWHKVAPVASKNPATLLGNAFSLASLARREGVDLFHVRSRAPAWSVLWAARMTGIPVVSTFHAAYRFNGRFKKFYNSVMARADRVIAISDFIGRHVADSYGVGPDRLRVIPRGIDLERFDPQKIDPAQRAALREKWSVPKGSQVLLLLGRLSPIKGHELFLNALALMPSDAPPWCAVILGDDQGRAAYRGLLESLVRGKGLESRVRFVPHGGDMPLAYAASDMAVVPSLVPEGFGRVPVEAMAMGLPVLASALGATQETVAEGQTGWLLPPVDPAAWAAAMGRALTLAAAEKEAMRQAARRRVETLFDKKIMLAKTLAVYDELLHKEA